MYNMYISKNYSTFIFSMWFGKIFGIIVGFILFTPLLGIGWMGPIIGLIVGHRLDQHINNIKKKIFNNNSEYNRTTKNNILKITFSVMGHIAKSDGTVLESDIIAARKIMNRMGLDPQARKEAINCYNTGKLSSFDLQKNINDILNYCRYQPGLIQTFVDIQVETASLEGLISARKKYILQQIFHQTGYSPMYTWNRNYQRNYNRHANQNNFNQGVSIDESYKILGISPQISDKELKLAYRRLMSQNHPDKLISKGLPDAMIKIANEKTQKIKAAYNRIKQIRNI